MLWTIDTASRTSLPEQIEGCVRRALASGELQVGQQLPPAQELGTALGVDRNTVLKAYRQLRDAGVLDFRRGRGVRVVAAAPPHAELHAAARDLVTLARRHGYSSAELITMIKEMS